MKSILHLALLWFTAIATAHASWPPQDEDLVFLFQDIYEEPFALDEQLDEPLLNFAFVPKGEARANSLGYLVLGRGHFIAPNQGTVLPLALSQGNGFSMELWLEPAKFQTGAVLALGDTFTLKQEDKQLLFILSAGGKQFQAAVKLPDLSGHHLIVTRQGPNLKLYMDGHEAANMTLSDQGLTKTKGDLTIGSGDHDRDGWYGEIADLAIYSGAMDPARAAAHHKAHEQVLSSRAEVKPLVVVARLTAKSKVPTPAQIEPYGESLFFYEYEIETVVEGFTWEKRIRVVHWGILDHQAMPVSAATVGEKHHLSLDAFTINRQLAGVNRSETLPLDNKIKVYMARKIVRGQAN